MHRKILDPLVDDHWISFFMMVLRDELEKLDKCVESTRITDIGSTNCFQDIGWPLILMQT